MDRGRGRKTIRGGEAAHGAPGHPLLRPGMAERTGGLDGRTGTGAAYGFPNVAIRSIRHSKSTRFSSMAGSRSP